MANWEEPQHPPRTSSRWQAPGIFVNLEFGVSFSPDHQTHAASMKYTSRRMEERLHNDRRRLQHENGVYYPPHPTSLTPGHPVNANRPSRQEQQYRQRRLGIRTREQHERGTSAPPSFTDRNEPVSPMSTMNSIPQFDPHFGPIQHTQSMPMERTNQPLPPTPSQFRLGEEDMPWSMPPWYRPPEPAFASPTVVGIDPENRRLDDPQRVRDLETLHQAMMTVDSLDHDGWEPWTWDSVGDMPRGPRSIGWAISSQDTAPRSPPVVAPPPYVVSQWEQAFGRSHSRPRSSG